MTNLYRLISEEELLELGKGLFKEWIFHYPLHFYVNTLPKHSFDGKTMFLVKCKTSDKTLNDFKMINNKELIVNEEKIGDFNTYLIDKIKLIDVFGDFNEFPKEILSIVEKEEIFFRSRLEIFLETNDRKIIPYDYFDQPVETVHDGAELTEEEKEQRFRKLIEEQQAFTKYCEERTSKINTVEEAVDFLIHEELSEDNINEIRNKSLASKFDDIVGLFGLGMYLRNVFIYPNKNENFLQYLKTYDPGYTVDRGEFGEGIIEDLLWRRLNHYRITDENKNKIAQLREQQYKEDLFWSCYIKEKLLSYNLDEAIIGQYLDLEDKKDIGEEDFELYHYQQKRILAVLSDGEIFTYDEMKQDYFTIKNLIERLKHKL